MTTDDALVPLPQRVISLAEEIGVSAACRAMGIHRSTYYRWRSHVLKFGVDILHPRERRPPRVLNSTSPLIEQRILVFALAHPTVGPQRIYDGRGTRQEVVVGVWQARTGRARIAGDQSQALGLGVEPAAFQHLWTPSGRCERRPTWVLSADPIS